MKRWKEYIQEIIILIYDFYNLFFNWQTKTYAYKFKMYHELIKFDNLCV
jgi:hypothetical protein